MGDYRTAYVRAGGTMSGLTLDGSRNGWCADFHADTVAEAVRAACLLLTPGT